MIKSIQEAISADEDLYLGMGFQDGQDRKLYRGMQFSGWKKKLYDYGYNLGMKY